MDVVGLLRRSPLWSQSPLAIAANMIVALAFVVVAGAVIIDFLNYHRQDAAVARSDRSFVETGSMTVFFIVYYLAIRLRMLEVPVGGATRQVMTASGLVLIVIGVAFNVWGRVLLKSSWANQIKIYKGQKLLTSGPFAVVRHPLYASLVWMFIGGALVYANPLALVLALGVFVPMMYVRAKKEDALLAAHFGAEHAGYKHKTGMFFPKVRGGRG